MVEYYSAHYAGDDLIASASNLIMRDVHTRLRPYETPLFEIQPVPPLAVLPRRRPQLMTRVFPTTIMLRLGRLR